MFLLNKSLCELGRVGRQVRFRQKCRHDSVTESSGGFLELREVLEGGGRGQSEERGAEGDYRIKN